MKAKTKTELVKEWADKNDICGDNPWFDRDNTYYNLRADQIIKLASYIQKNSK
jgi:hypothetical protein